MIVGQVNRRARQMVLDLSWRLRPYRRLHCHDMFACVRPKNILLESKVICIYRHRCAVTAWQPENSTRSSAVTL